MAVKTTKEDVPQKEVGDLLAEMRIMQQIGPHPNVVTLLGVAVEKGKYWRLRVKNCKSNLRFLCYCLLRDLDLDFQFWMKSKATKEGNEPI